MAPVALGRLRGSRRERRRHTRPLGIGQAFDAGQTNLDLVAVGFSLGLAGSVLYLGALGGIAAGMAYPTTLALITALWSGPPRTRSIALWSGVGGAIAALGPVISGALLTQFDWQSVFVVTLPLALLALVMAVRYVPSHVNEGTGPVDNLGGIVSAVFVGALVLAINFAPADGEGTLAIGLGVAAILAGSAFFVRQRRAPSPLHDLRVAARPTFWVAAVAGIIVFGALMAAMFIGQQFLQNVLGYSTLDAGLAVLPAAVLLVLVAPRSASSSCSCSGRRTSPIGRWGWATP
ncbi:hypothetical protein BH20ACT15_BH20ACT15_16210 [soil metagenome]